MLFRSGNFWARKKRISKWWYVKWLDHNIFWNERSLKYMACKFGFEIRSITKIKHRTKMNLGALKNSKALFKFIISQIGPDICSRIYEYFGKEANCPGNPLSKDHMRAILYKY